MMAVWRPSTLFLETVTILVKWMEPQSQELQSVCAEMKWYNNNFNSWLLVDTLGDKVTLTIHKLLLSIC